MKNHAGPHLLSADPGSSDKGWTVAEHPFESPIRARIVRYDIDRLGELIDLVSDKAQDRHVLLALDVPLKAFGGVQFPEDFDPPGHSDGNRYWPFNVNPFSFRPCEKALSSKPRVMNRNLSAPDLATAIGALCNWAPECNAGGNACFTGIHEGLSVLGYQGAPHAPVVATFLRALKERADRDGFQIRYETPIEGGKAGSVTVLESHPALTLALLCTYGVAGFPETLPKYKPDVDTDLADALEVHVRNEHGVELGAEIQDDDALDAFAGLLNLLDLVKGTCDVFGTERDGYFLIPARSRRPIFRDLWSQAAAAL